MISIEEDEDNRDRFLFNRPYGCINIHFGKSFAAVQEISWDKPTILWMDYDCKPKEEILLALSHICRHAVHGSAMIISLNVHGLDLKQVRTDWGEERISDTIVPTDFNGWGGAKVCRQVLMNEIVDRLSERNGVLKPEENILFRQLFNFNYEDGARMLSFGGILCQADKLQLFDQCSFESLPFVRQGEEAYEIEVPVLTLREISGLDAKLPGGDLSKFAAIGIPQTDLDKYRNIYRYFPRFSESEI